MSVQSVVEVAPSGEASAIRPEDFEYKPFQEMTEADYTAVGFRSGLEIHQQLLTEKKLFCRCPAGRYSERYHAEILRHMRPTLSELGEYDGTALMEFKTRKEIIYRINRETVCTYEMDDTPPFELNDQALDIALAIGQMYGCSMVDEIHIARKQYLDGSIPTGFQRTTIVGVNGSVPYRDRRIDIVQLGLEEDSCRELADIGHRRFYNTDRLGMPLIETVTAPQMKTPSQVAEVGDILRRMVRSTGLVRTGIGAARQDVNVSVHGGTRIEIKGVSRLTAIPLLTYNESMRQWNLLRLRGELQRRNVTPETFRSRTEDVTRLLRKTRYEPIRTAVAEGRVAKAVTLFGFAGLLRYQTQTDTYFAQEIADRVRVIACLTTLPNLIHSDRHMETLTNAEWMAVKKAAGASEGDTVVVVWGDLQDAETAAREVAIRAREATLGVPSETRQALDDGTNGFERILPGPDRMYPDTDLPPKRIMPERLARLRDHMPRPFWELEAWYRQLGIPEDTIRPLSISRYTGLFDRLVRQMEISPTLAAVALVQQVKRLQRKGLRGELSLEVLEEIFAAYKSGRISSEGIWMAMERLAGGEAFEPPPHDPDRLQHELEEALQQGLRAMLGMQVPAGPKRMSTLMGLVMRHVRGRVEGERVWRSVRVLVGEVA